MKPTRDTSRTGLRALLTTGLVCVLHASPARAAPPLFESPFRSFDALPAAWYYPITVADLDHDGMLDVVSAPQGSPTPGLRVWLGRPDFELSGPRYFIGSGNGGSQSLAIADLDGDGIPDVLVGGDGWGYFHGRGDGTFGPYVPEGSDQVGAVAAVDLNGDGITDIIGTTTSAGLIVRLGRGGGVMDSASIYHMFLGLDPSGGLAIADVNGDGLPDALISHTVGVRWVVLGTPGGGFGPPVPPTLFGAGGRFVFTGDFNRDGRVDFVTGQNVYLGHGDGSFDTGPTLGAEVAGIADFDGDGNLDLVLLHDASVEILGGRGDGTFVSRGEFPCGRHPWSVAVGDMNADGRLDLVVSVAPAYGGAPAFSVLIGDGHGGFGVLPTVPTGGNPRKVLAADVTGDGIPDLITAERGKRRVAVRPGLGALRFGAPFEFETTPGLTTAILADLDADGRLDLITASDSSSTLSTLPGTLGSVFGTRRDFSAGGAPVALAAGDFDEDGHPDLVSMNHDSWSLLRGDGSDGLMLAQTTSMGTHGCDVASTDFNNDGHLDVVTLDDSWGSYAVVLPGDGTGAFGWPLLLSHAYSAHAMAIGDIDRNGWKDLAVVVDSTSHGALLVRLMDSFMRSSDAGYIIGSNLTDVLLADLDGDGILDVAVACHDANAVTVMRGHADGSFSDRVDYGVADGPVSLAAVDLDGDGAPELLVACDRANVVTILHNLSAGLATPTLVSLVDSRADAGGVHLTWDAGGLPGLRATVERRIATSPWVTLAGLTANGTGRLNFTDAQVEPGRTYFYRLGWLDQGVTRHSAEAQVIVPARAGLALAGARPNPADARLNIAFSLPDASPATLELHDLAGRVLARREVGGLGGGDHVVALGDGLNLRPGLYWIRLARGPRSFSVRAAVLR